MTRTRGWALAAAVVAVASVGSRVHAAEAGDRIGAVVAARIELQRQLGEMLTSSLARPAEPYRVEAAVRLDLRGIVREIRAKQANVTPSVKIGGKSRVKLPGLGMVGGGGQGNLLPEIAIDGGTKITESVSHQLETEVVKMTVLLFVDPVMPKERRELLVRLAAELAGVDPSRGDEVVIEERASPAGQAGSAGGLPTVVQATIQSPSRLPWEVILACATALAAAAILAFGLSRRATEGRPGGRRGRWAEEGVEAGAGATAPAEASRAEEAERSKRREELGAFKDLAGATPREVVQVVAEADPHTASAIADLYGFDGEAAALLERMVPPQRRAEIGIGLASTRVISRDQLAQMENVAAQLLQRVRNRVQLGGPGRLAELLAVAPSGMRKEMLEVVAARNPDVADAARRSIVLFEDLAGLDDPSVRQVVASVDPSTVAVALVGAPEARDVVLGAVSKRLRGVIEAEEEAVGEKGVREVETARRAIEDAMRVLNGRGDLRPRAA